MSQWPKAGFPFRSRSVYEQRVRDILAPALPYVAAGRPVVTQDTGFGHNLPTGAGLFGYSTTDEALAAIESINADYPRHRRAARSIAREYFDSEIVLRKLLAECGVSGA